MKKSSLLPLFLILPLCGEESPSPFGALQTQASRIENLESEIQQRKEEILNIKNHWKEKLPIHLSKTLQENLEKGTLLPCEEGCGGTYILYSSTQVPLYVIKPFDEEMYCLNNRKQFASPFHNQAIRVRDNIPLYRTMQTEALAFAIATELGLDHLIPPVHLAIISHENFHDIKGKKEEKLCTIQPYLAEKENLQDLLEKWNELPEENLLTLIDQEDFEKLTLLIWLLYDTDAHVGNLYARQDANGVYHLMKFDQGLTLPITNKNLKSALYFFPHAKNRLSAEGAQLLVNLPFEKLKELFHQFEMDDTYEAFYERGLLLQAFAQKGTLTLREIEIQLRKL